MTPVQQLLTAAADLIEQKGWTQGAYARTAKGNVIGPVTPGAACFCSIGALNRAAAESTLFGAYYPAVDAVTSVVGGGLINWNDTAGRTQAEVVAAFRKAAEVTQ